MYECCFVVGEPLAALGVIQSNNTLGPLTVDGFADSNVIDKEGFDVFSYKSLAQKFPKVILSDKPELIESLISAKVPQYQQQQLACVPGTLVTFSVPAGAAPKAICTSPLPDGRTVQATIPPNAGPRSTFQVAV